VIRKSKPGTLSFAYTTSYEPLLINAQHFAKHSRNVPGSQLSDSDLFADPRMHLQKSPVKWYILAFYSAALRAEVET